jgi:hypothetical protein
MALIGWQSAKHVAANGGGIAFAAAASGDTIEPDDHGVLMFENTGVSSTITIPAPPGLDFGVSVMPDLSYTLGATTGRQYIPMSRMLADPVTGLITVNLSSVAGVTRAAVRL